LPLHHYNAVCPTLIVHGQQPAQQVVVQQQPTPQVVVQQQPTTQVQYQVQQQQQPAQAQLQITTLPAQIQALSSFLLPHGNPFISQGILRQYLIVTR
jgi:hypothetical protein